MIDAKINRTLNRTLGLVAALALPLLGLTSCESYKYVEVHVAFDGAAFDSSSTADVQVCVVTVSGADSGSFSLPPGRCPNKVPDSTGVISNPLDAGTFGFTTFADSGTLTFKVQAYTGAGRQPDCIIGEGTTGVALTGPQPFKGTLTIMKSATGKVCNNSTPLTDSGTNL